MHSIRSQPRQYPGHNRLPRRQISGSRIKLPKDTNPYTELSRIVDEHKAKYRPPSDPDYPEYVNISAFVDDVLKAAGVTEVYDCDGYTPAELLFLSIRRQLEKHSD